MKYWIDGPHDFGMLRLQDYKPETYTRMLGITVRSEIRPIKLTKAERDDFERVENEWLAWQRRLGEAWRESE